MKRFKVISIIDLKESVWSGKPTSGDLIAGRNGSLRKTILMARKAKPYDAADNQYLIRSVLRAANVLGAFRFEGEQLRLRDVVTRTGLHKTTVFRLLSSLEAGGLVVRAAADRYQSKVKPMQWSGLKFGLAGRINGQPFAEEMVESMKQAAEREGIDLPVLENRRGSRTALLNADRLIRAGVDLAFVYQPDHEIAPAVATKFVEADIPLIAIAFPHPSATYYGANNFQAGQMGGRALGRWANQHWDGDVDEALFMKPPKVGPVPQSRLIGMEAGIRETLPEVRHYRVAVLNAEPRYSATLEAVRRYLRGCKAKRIVIGSMNDSCAIAALRAFEEAGRAEDCVAVGQGASLDGRLELRRPQTRLIGTVSFSPENYGGELMALGLKILSKQPVPAAVIVKHQLVTPDNVDRLYPNDRLQTEHSLEALL